MTTKVHVGYRVLPGTKDRIEAGAKSRKIGSGEYLDLIVTWPPPTQEGDQVVRTEPERVVTVAEELELPNGLLKITRDEDGLPVAFVRAKASQAWIPVDWKRLELLNVEVQGLKRDKLAEEVKRIRAARVKIESGLSATARHMSEEEKDTAGQHVYCVNDRRILETFGEEESCRNAGHLIREADSQELYAGKSSRRGVEVGRYR